VSRRKGAAGQLRHVAKTPDGTGWMDRAACKGTDLSLFFPAPPAPTGRKAAPAADITEAVAYCRRCPVRDECARFAEANDIQIGVWAAKNRDTRKRARREAA
jgi:WhiB family transcriptional regulator, redox-sensing transcriptional regulator